jgi:hypothetical protein
MIKEECAMYDTKLATAADIDDIAMLLQANTPLAGRLADG